MDSLRIHNLTVSVLQHQLHGIPINNLNLGRWRAVVSRSLLTTYQTAS